MDIEEQRESHKFKNRKYNNSEPIFVNGVDRVDSNGDYVKDNCVPCCTTCNRMKMDMSYNIFIKHIIKIRNYRKR
jgi:hypothetical protein